MEKEKTKIDLDSKLKDPLAFINEDLKDFEATHNEPKMKIFRKYDVRQ